MHADFSLRPLTTEDAAEVARLSNAAAVHDDTDELISEADQEESWGTPGFDLNTDSMAALSPAGRLLGAAEIRLSDATLDGEIRAHVHAEVDPEARGRGIGTTLTNWGIRRGRELAAERFPGIPPALEAWGRGEDSDAAALLADFGFEPGRWFTDMRIDLSTWDDPEEAEGGQSRGQLIGRTMRPEDETAVLLAKNEAFEDHWGSSPTSATRWAHIWRQRMARLELSRLAESDHPDPDQRVDALVFSEEWVPGELYIALVGTRRRARGRGLATRLLTDVVRAARSAGMRRVDLGVDAASPTGANGVYERVGFRPVRTGVSMLLR